MPSRSASRYARTRVAVGGSADQRAGFYFRRGSSTGASAVDITGRSRPGPQLHNTAGTARVFPGARAGAGLDHGATKPLVKGTAAGGRVTTETDNNRPKRD